MRSDDWSRRKFLAGTLAVAGSAAGVGVLLRGWPSGRDEADSASAPPAPAAQRPTVKPARHVILAPQNLGTHRTALGVFDVASSSVRTIPTPMLGHSVVCHPSRPDVVAVLGQRPVKSSCLLSLSTGEILQTFGATKERHFYGHGTYSTDGRVLYATENEDETGLGYVVARDATTLAVLGELSSHGMGPHELLFSADGKTAIIANGGAISLEGAYADDGEAPSSLCYVEVASGKLLERHVLADPQLSIRHLGLGSRGDVIAALRRYPEPSACPTLVMHRAGGSLRLTQPDATLMARMNGLALSIAVEPEGRVAGATHPDGDAVTFWDVATVSLLGVTAVEKPEGIAVLPNGSFLVTSLNGTLMTVDPATHVGTALGEARGLNWKHAIPWQLPA